MKYLIIYFLFILPLQCFAIEKEIVILTSIKNPSANPFWRSNSYEISKDIETQYKKVFAKSGYKIVIKHRVDRETLSNYLTSDKTLALFWVSHAISESTLSGVNLSSVIEDYTGNNIKNVFQKINKNIKFVSIVGCKANPILKKFKAMGLYSSELELHSFDKKIGLNKGIRISIKAASKVLDENPRNFRNALDKIDMIEGNYRDFIKQKIALSKLPVLEEEKTLGDRVTIINTNPDYSAELVVGGHYLGLLKKGDEPQEVVIPKSLYKNMYKLIVNYDVETTAPGYTVSPLRFLTLPAELSVDYLKNRDGSVYGLNKNFYYLKKRPTGK